MSAAAKRWVAYLVRCRDGSLYAGATNDIARRVDAHNRGQGAAYTRSRRPVRLVYTVRARDRSDALRREAALKRLTRAEKLATIRRVARRRRSRRSSRAGSAGSRS